MAKRKSSFDPDALDKLAQAGQEIANKHKDREQEFTTKTVTTKNNTPSIEEKTVAKMDIPKEIPVKKTTTKRGARTKKTKEESPLKDQTSLCRIGTSYHKRLKMEAVKQGTSIRNLLENLIGENIPTI